MAKSKKAEIAEPKSLIGRINEGIDELTKSGMSLDKATTALLVIELQRLENWVSAIDEKLDDYIYRMG